MDLWSRLPPLPTSARLILIWAILFLPAALALWLMPQRPWETWIMLVTATFCIALGLWLLRSLPRTLSLLVLGGLITLILSIRFVQLGLVNFSGADFSTEFFLHLDWYTFNASWQLYGWRIPLGFACGLLVIYGCLQMTMQLPALNARQALAGSLVAMVGLFWSMHSLPEARLYHATTAQFRQLENIPELRELQQRWRNSALVNPAVTYKSALRVVPPARPKNLILVYLESVGVSMLDNPQWPELMPHLKTMHQQHSLVSHFHASGFITIEGIVNSHCGTLFPFYSGSDSLANGTNLAENMPCLGDILQEAGYDNHYLGGAQLDFSGKGAFLKAHGYPNPRGIKHWQSIGLKSRPGKWGLSDPDLFAQATQLLSALQEKDTPFHLNLLTIGTHLPGFSYRECQPYPHSEDSFLNALHCTDQLLQQWLEQMTDAGLLENTLVAITADHQVFSNSSMRNLFGDAVYDRRLPFILLDTDELPTPARDTGAGYDLAPTLLDILNINHNVQFPLGRSLLEDTDHPRYFVNRYEDMVDLNVTIRGMKSCETKETPPESWSELMTKCQKSDLFNLLRRQIESLSDTHIILDCNRPKPLAASLAAEGGVRLEINQRDIAHQFTRAGKPISKDRPGLYMAWFDQTGKLLNLQFASAGSAGKRIKKLPYEDTAHSWLALWAPKENSNLPNWLPGSNNQPGIFWGVKNNGDIHWQTIDETGEAGLDWALSQQHCHDLYH